MNAGGLVDHRKLFASSVLSFALALTLAGCATNDVPPDGRLDAAEQTGNGPYLEATEHRKQAGDWSSAPLSQSELPRILRGFLVPAKLADAVYRREFNNNAEARIKDGCSYTSNDAGLSSTLSQLPQGWVRVREQHLSQWRIKIDEDAKNNYLCLSGKGLAYELYARLGPDGKPVELVLAFRGTENDSEQWPYDWGANLSQTAFGLFDNKSYRGAREAARKTVERFRGILPAVEPTTVCRADSPTGKQLPITFVGHSLGGGLAQHAAYAVSACDSLRAMTFNTSPVTGWFYLSWHSGELKNRDPLIVRVYNDKEVLAYLRGVTTFANSPRENRLDYQLAFRDFKDDRHSMALLACWIEQTLHMADGQMPLTMTTGKPCSGEMAIESYNRK